MSAHDPAATLAQQVLVKVIEVRSQNRIGVLFRGQRIAASGEIIDANLHVTVSARRREIAVTILEGQWWEVSGQIRRRTFINALGFEMTEEQLEVERGGAHLRLPSGIHLADYVSRNPSFSGVGKITVDRLWETFDKSLFDILDRGDVERLSDFIPKTKAEILVNGWRKEGLSNTLQWLHVHGVDVLIARRILSYFGAEAPAKITENPYRLLSFSAAWAPVDKLARSHLQVAPDDERRVTAAVEEAVYARFTLGDTYVTRADLVSGLRDLLRHEHHSRQLIEAAIERAKVTGRLLFDDDGNACSLGASILENRVVDCILARLDREPPPTDIDALIRAHETRAGLDFPLTPEQRDAVRLAAREDFAVITGGAGAGKTTALKCLYDVLESSGYKVTQLALAGKAVRRMLEATNRQANTLASFIANAERAKNQPQELTAHKSALVIDEASMVDLVSFSNVARLVENDTKIILVGDPNQLPPVGPGLILHSLVNVPGIPHVKLGVSRRFGSEIAGVADAIINGLLPLPDQLPDAVGFIEAQEAEMGELASTLYLQQPDNSVVLCATRRVAKVINARLQEALTKEKPQARLFDREMEMWEHIGIHQDDLLICTRNHWDLGIANGSLGKLIEVFEEPKLIDHPDEPSPYLSLGWIEWDDGVVRALRDTLIDSIELGYALTVHKAQGSQWKHAIVCLPTIRGKHGGAVDRSMVYTAVTRAQSRVVICGEHEHLARAVKREMAADRRKVALPRRLAARMAQRDAGNGGQR